jgi:RimJ/RimL family protein N-acetyltransferase
MSSNDPTPTLRHDPRNVLPGKIVTARLVLRAPMRADVPAMAELANNRKIYDATKRMPYPYTRADGIGFVEIICQRASTRAYAICADETFLGIVSLMFAEGHPPELGYWLGEPYWAKGYMSEAVKALLDAAHANGQFPIVKATALADNAGSLGVLEKNGFVRIGSYIETIGHNTGKLVISLLLERRP